MGDKTRIEWTDATWNPVDGCTPLSQGCTRCYARAIADRFWGRQETLADGPKKWYGRDLTATRPRSFSDVLCHRERLEIPFHWRRSRKIFVCSMGDLFHEGVPDGFIRDVWEVMAQCSQHTFQILTKRPRRMVEWMERYAAFAGENVWLGASVESDEYIWRIDELVKAWAAVRWVSYEPALGPLNLASSSAALDWVVAGGETGPAARPAHPDWFRRVRDHCKARGIPFFLKQWGEWLPCDEASDAQQYGPARHQISLAGEPSGHRDCGQWLRVGRKAAGHLLDGEEWRQWPRISKGS